MAKIRIHSIKVKNYRSFGDVQSFKFPDETHNKPVSIVGYNNAGKTNLINAIKYGLYESVREDTFELKDFHNCNWDNSPYFQLEFSSSGLGVDKIEDGNKYTNTISLEVKAQKIESVTDGCSASQFNGKIISKKWGIKQNAPIFYINFHKIKEEISTQKTSWGNLKSFLAKHIKQLVDTDDIMKGRKDTFNKEVEKATKNVLEGEVSSMKKSKLLSFINTIEENYSQNLRNNDCKVEFGLPNYEDIFLQMMFKIGLNGNKNNLIPIDHFGDGFISMFVMAVIQAIAENSGVNKGLFLFEEPESFLHENHQEYFYKMVLCSLAEKGHQVIYTTHSDRMVDIFDTQSLIRLELEKKETDDWQTISKFNDPDPISKQAAFTSEGVDLSVYNNYINYIEPNLNKILFSKKVILVEGPNDILVYRRTIERKVLEKIEQITGITQSYKERYAQTYLSFMNIAIITHYGKSTALLLTKLCNYVVLDYFVITDWDFKIDFIEKIELDIDVLMQDPIWEEIKKETNHEGNVKKESNIKSMITNNRNLSKAAKGNQIHFNFPRLEEVLGYSKNDKDSSEIWDKLNKIGIDTSLFPEKLELFLEIDNIDIKVVSKS